MKTLVCLVSRQVMANLIPILTLSVEKIELLYTKEEKRSHENLKRVLANTGLGFEINEHLIDAYDFEGIQEKCEELIDANDDILLNTTGGTKVMAFAAFSVFTEHKKKIFYLDSFNNKAIRFNPYSVEEHRVKIPLDIMLAAHGYRILENQTPEDMLTRKPLVDFLRRFYHQVAPALAQYRRFVFDKNYNFVPISVSELGFEINPLGQGKMKVRFINDHLDLDDPRYLDGFWLEELVYWLIRDKGWDDIRVGVSLTYEGSEQETDPLNEVDVMGIKNGKLYLFSCKSGITKDKKDVFELEALRSLAGGTFGKAFFVTSTPVSREKHLYERCKELKIQMFDHRSFLELKKLKF